MTTFLLIRHGDNDLLGKQVLAGRSPGVFLNANGRSQALQLARRLAALPIEAIYSSPLERTRETAQPLAEEIGKPVQIMQEITEVEFGEWTGCRFDQLANDPKWKAFNTFRSSTRTPGGEMSIQVQQRMIGALEALRNRHSQAMVALFSHGDPIRTVIAHFLGMPLDFALRLRISPASLSVVEYTARSARVLCVNHSVATDGVFPF